MLRLPSVKKSFLSVAGPKVPAPCKVSALSKRRSPTSLNNLPILSVSGRPKQIQSPNFRLWRVRTTAPTKDQDGKTQMSSFNGSIFKGVHHVGLLCDELERSMAFYIDVLGLTVNSQRPDDKLPYRGAWLMVGPEMIHLMELPNPDPMEDRPEHGGRDRHFCIAVEEGAVEPLMKKLTEHGVEYTQSKSGRAAVFFRDPDMNCLEVVEMTESWR